MYLLGIIRMGGKTLKRLQVRTFERLVAGVQGMEIRGGKAENLRK
jgi:hypothetical protein